MLDIYKSNIRVYYLMRDEILRELGLENSFYLGTNLIHWVFILWMYYKSLSHYIFTLIRHVKVNEPGSHRLAHHEPGWKWMNPTRLTFWWARNFVTRLNPPQVGGLSGLAHQPI